MMKVVFIYLKQNVYAERVVYTMNLSSLGSFLFSCCIHVGDLVFLQRDAVLICDYVTVYYTVMTPHEKRTVLLELELWMSFS